MIKEKKKVEQETYGASQICVLMKFNQNTRDYVFHKYSSKIISEKDWKSLFKKDGLNF